MIPISIIIYDTNNNISEKITFNSFAKKYFRCGNKFDSNILRNIYSTSATIKTNLL